MLLPYASDDPAKLAEFEKVRPLVVHLLRFVALYSYFDAMAIVGGISERRTAKVLNDRRNYGLPRHLVVDDPDGVTKQNGAWCKEQLVPLVN